MHIVLGVAVIGFLATLVAAALTGRLSVRTCCTYIPPERDLRMTPIDQES
ncbi:MAG: hypothetical protein F2793_05355 [Actinobacteria bacterium]|nr:hypothetical protein [Actinomycetota bacterium]